MLTFMHSFKKKNCIINYINCGAVLSELWVLFLLVIIFGIEIIN